MSNRRSPMDVVRDTAWRLATAMMTGPTPEPRIRAARVAGQRPTAGRFLLVVGALVAVAATALLVVLLVTRPYHDSVKPERAAGLPDRPPAPAAPSVSATPTPTATTAATKPPSSPSRAGEITVSVTPSPGRSEASAPLAATYTTTPYLVGLLGYRTEVTVANPGPESRQGWTLTVTLPRSELWINDVKGAAVTRQEAVWTFVPDATTAGIEAGEQVGISFEVHGATLIDAAPADCRIDGAPCTR